LKFYSALRPKALLEARGTKNKVSVWTVLHFKKESVFSPGE